MNEKKRYVMVYDSNKCIGCQSCSIACRAENKVPDGAYRLQVWVQGPKGKYPDLAADFHRQSCVMCDNPPCVPVCPTGASYINKEGVTLVNHKKCTGCKYCVVACPYKSRFINPKTGEADKCTFCWETRVSKGEKPACVSVCPTGALEFGDALDPKSKVRSIMKTTYTVQAKAHLGTKPKLITVPNGKGGEV